MRRAGELIVLAKWQFSKRQKFILISVLLSFILLFSQFFEIPGKFLIIFGMAILAAGLTLWSLWIDLARIKFLTVVILPIYFTVSAGLFYFLLPSILLIRMGAAAIFGILFYLLLLTENIFNVAAIRTIQLARAADAVGFLFTVFSAFFLFQVLASFQMPAWAIFLLAANLTFPLIVQVLWFRELEEFLSKKLLIYAVILTLVIAQIGLILSFWPLEAPIFALGMAGTVYLLTGLSQLELSERLNKKVVAEFLAIGVVLVLVVLLGAKWAG